jgi:hypothetical protein
MAQTPVALVSVSTAFSGIRTQKITADDHKK